MNNPCCKSSVKASEQVAELLKKYQKRTEETIQQHLPSFGKGKLKAACEYALTTGGRRFRPALVFMVADALGHGLDVSKSALSIEFFHTASLIADDLPCMDDDDERRNKPSLHKAFDEATALLASYALIAAGNACIAACAMEISNQVHPLGINSYQLGILALDNAACNTGTEGTTGGQYLDINPPDLTLKTLREVIQKKTVSLFEVSFVFGWLFGGGHPDSLPLIKQCASHFGMAFQIADDLGDVDQDAINGRKINMAGVFGVEVATKMFHEEIAGYRTILKKLGLESKELMGLACCLENQIL